MIKSSIYTYLSIFAFLIFTSCEEILIVNDISKEEVTIIAPSNGTILSSSGVTFSWDAIKSADKYRLQVALPSFEAAQQLILDTIVSKNSFIQQLNIGKYQWRVRALNNAYETAYTTHSFEILNNDDFQNNTVILLTPSNNLITKTALQRLSWNSIIGATAYQLEIADENGTLVKQQNSADTFLSHTFEDGKFTWKVRASNGTNETLYTTRSIVVDTKVPNTPTLTSPTNASTTTATSINFQWSRTPIAGSAEKDSIFVFNDSALTNLNFKDLAVNPYNKTLTAGIHYWYVKSYDAAGNESVKSTTFSFTIN